MSADREVRGGTEEFRAELAAMWDEGVHVPLPALTPEAAREIERIDAGSVTLVMRRVRMLVSTWCPLTREAWAKRFELLAQEFGEAARFLRRLRVDDDPPQFICSQSPPVVSFEHRGQPQRTAAQPSIMQFIRRAA